MPEGKWIEGLTAETPVADAARSVLHARLKVIDDYLPLAVNKAHEDIEYVHQLRVATRRAGAALKMFDDCLPGKRGKAARKQLRRLRQAASEAREWDVFLEMLDRWSKSRPAADKPGVIMLAGYATARRADAQRHLAEAARHGLDTSELVAAIEAPRPEAPRRLGELSIPLIDGLIDDFDRSVAEDTGDYDHLHRIRIRGKRLRYAMEVVAVCFAPAFRNDMYPTVEEMQETLGDANDSHVTVGRLTDIRQQLKEGSTARFRQCRPGLDRLLQNHRRQLPSARKKFRAWLKKWQPLRAAFNDWARIPDPHADEDREKK
jgi:CHAD domain-containing protein